MHNLNSIVECTLLTHCKTCLPDSCNAINNYTLYKVKEYGSISGIDKMKAEIYHNGPIACGIAATFNFDKYNGGVYKEKSNVSINHIISVFFFCFKKKRT